MNPANRAKFTRWRKTGVRLIIYTGLVLGLVIPIVYLIFRTKNAHSSLFFKHGLSFSADMDPSLLPEKLIHLDLKGAPPLVSYLREFFPFIKKLGVTGVLIEYEDMFPYRGKLEEIKALNAYTRSDIREILNLTESYGLKVIPLIQVFGHFEFVLKLESFKKFREVKLNPQALCPSHKEVHFLIREMIDQILELHPKVKHLHIGCDEVYYLGECQRCRDALWENKWTKNDLYLNHVKKVATYIRNNYPRVRPIMWSDMVGKIDVDTIRKHKIPDLVGQMIWNYRPNLKETKNRMLSAAHLFKSVWIASAFKGATGMGAVITDTKYHLKNHEAWKEIVMEWQNSLHFNGIVLTGWQRYNHFAELCELLPVGIPSLASNLKFLNTRNIEMDDAPALALKLFGCSSSIVFSPSDLKNVKVRNCIFPGFDVYRLVVELYQFKPKAQQAWNAFKQLPTYNMVYQFSDPYNAEKMFQSLQVTENFYHINTLEENLRKALSKVYDQYTVNEWISTHVTPIRIKWNALYNVRKGMLEQDVWPRRPLLQGIDPLENASNEICSPYRTTSCGLLLV